MLLAIGVLVATLLVLLERGVPAASVRSSERSGARVDHRGRLWCDAPGGCDARAYPAAVGRPRCGHRRFDATGGRDRMSAITVYLLLLKAIGTSFAGMGSLPQIQQDFVETRRAITAEQLSQAVLSDVRRPGRSARTSSRWDISQQGGQERSLRGWRWPRPRSRPFRCSSSCSAGCISRASEPPSMRSWSPARSCFSRQAFAWRLIHGSSCPLHCCEGV